MNSQVVVVFQNGEKDNGIENPFEKHPPFLDTNPKNF